MVICAMNNHKLQYTTMNKAFITSKDAARRYSMSDQWFRNQRSNGIGPPFVRVGRKVLYDVDAVDKWFRGE